MQIHVLYVMKKRTMLIRSYKGEVVYMWVPLLNFWIYDFELKKLKYEIELIKILKNIWF